MTYSTGKLPNVACATFFKGIADWNADGLLAGFTQSKQWRIKFFYRYKRAKTSRITVLNIRKLYLYFVYFKLYVYFEWSPQSLWKMMRAKPGKSPIVTMLYSIVLTGNNCQIVQLTAIHASNIWPKCKFSSLSVMAYCI